jgi:hypothetical protein
METLGWILFAWLFGFVVGCFALSAANRSECDVLKAQIRALGGVPK